MKPSENRRVTRAITEWYSAFAPRAVGARSHEQLIREERVLPGDGPVAQSARERHERAGSRLERILDQLSRRVQRAVAGDVLIAPLRQGRRVDALDVLDRERPVVQVLAERRTVADRRHPAAAEGALHENVPLPRLAVLEVAVEACLSDAVHARVGLVPADRRRDRRRIGEPNHRHAGRVRAVRPLHHAAREVGGSVVGRTREVPGVRRQVGDPEAAAHDRLVIPLIRSADARADIVVSRVPQIAAVAVDAGEREPTERPEGVRLREIQRDMRS